MKRDACEICGGKIEPGRGWKRYCPACKARRIRERAAKARATVCNKVKARTSSRHDDLFVKMQHAFGRSSFNTKRLSMLMGKATPEGLGPVIAKMEREGRIERVARCTYRIKR